MRLFILALILSASGNANATLSDSTRAKKWYEPHFIPLQFAGNIGFLSTGVGYTSNNRNYQLALMYGYVPQSVAKSTIHAITAKNNFPFGIYGLKNNKTLIPYLGLGLTVEVGGNAFFRMPSHFPESYYDFPKNLHVIAYGGARLQHFFDEDVRWLRGMEFFGEAGTVDVYLWYRTISRQIKFRQMFSVAIGVNVLLHHR